MEFAFNCEQVRVRAQRGIVANCPLCEGGVVAKCGKINIHHWAHKTNKDCDPWWERESEWHRSWKGLFPDHQVEVTIGRHRADIVRKNGQVVELQHSSISVKEIAEREKFYGSMIWLFDGRELEDNRFSLRDKGKHFSFRWKNPRKHSEKEHSVDEWFRLREKSALTGRYAYGLIEWFEDDKMCYGYIKGELVIKHERKVRHSYYS